MRVLQRGLRGFTSKGSAGFSALRTFHFTWTHGDEEAARSGRHHWGNGIGNRGE
jgi:hypothetical protein